MTGSQSRIDVLTGHFDETLLWCLWSPSDPRFVQDGTGSDLATVLLDYASDPGLSLATEPVLLGTDVYTFGYPLTEKRRMLDGHPSFGLQERFLQGYVTRRFFKEHPHFGRSLPMNWTCSHLKD